jgi:hypothetical protein
MSSVMKFLKLLDPSALPTNDISAPGKQQRRAFEIFPTLVSQSRLHYWSPGDSIRAIGERYLIGLAASFDLRDLRLADIINEVLGRETAAQVDVFNLEDCQTARDLPKYFPDLSGTYYQNPLVGMWRDGIHITTKFGFDARRFILESLKSPVPAADSVAGLCPPDRRLIED